MVMLVTVYNFELEFTLLRKKSSVGPKVIARWAVAFTFALTSDLLVLVVFILVASDLTYLIDQMMR